MKIDFAKGAGLVPAIIQNADTEQVLMLGYMNADALTKTKETGLVTFYSRSRDCLWCKGETSGNTLAFVDMKVDCDGDTLLVRAHPSGPTCHKGTVSCFGDQGPEGSRSYGWLGHLGEVIEGRKHASPSTSYTAELLQGSLAKCAQKVGEEGVETVIAALAETDERLTSEAADLLYHLMVLLSAKGLTLNDIIAELKSRT